jgi:D-alanyl-lipoteichoic acid acyltransferase DltB (MBOAT superfamily)
MPLPFENDLLQRKALLFNLTLVNRLVHAGMSGSLAKLIVAVLPPLELIALVGLLALAAARVDSRLDSEGPGATSWWTLAAYAVAVLCALGLLVWMYLHPAAELSALANRWDYLAFAILAGTVLRRVPLGARIWTFALLSVVLVATYIGRTQVTVILAGCLLGFAASRWPVTNRPRRRLVVQGVLMGGVFAWLWWLRSSDPLSALQGWALYSFVLFRHLSFVVESSRGVPATLGGYLCFLLFYPNCIGAMEVYDEFWERNLTADGAREHGRAALMVVKGYLLLWISVVISMVISMDEREVTSSVGFMNMWIGVLVLFVRGACGIMGLWNVIEGGALFLGIRLRPNFRGVLTATDPSQFWRAWRGTMTNWLIRYIYIPLGGNRRHRTFNILAAFVVSTAWHCLGVVFLRPTTWAPYELAPLVTWGAVNFSGVATHAWVRRRWPPVGSRPPLRSALRVLKLPLTLCFASFTVLLLGFSFGGIERFGHVVRTLLGLEGW